MNNLVHKIPFLRITVAFAAGIILSSSFPLSFASTIVVAIAIVAVLIFSHVKYRYTFETAFGVLIIVLFALIGQIFHTHYNQLPTFYEKGTLSGVILERPQEKQNSYKSIIQVKSFVSNDSIFSTNEKILVYFEKSDNVKQINPGDKILINSTPSFVRNYGNPFEFDYKTYLNRKRIYRQVFIKSSNWRTTGLSERNLLIRAELLREKLLQIYRSKDIGANETEILSALTLGYKKNLEPETKRIFSAAGAMHVLAVSGLHVGILFLVFSWVFGFLRRQKQGKFVFVILLLLILWSYAFITGLSPSVLRASTMFTLVCIAENTSRRSNIYNSLAISALFLLIINPNNIFEVGFQLSYSAVFGIVYLQPKLKNLWRIKNKAGVKMWELLCVSVAAQIATFPITSYYFNQFPTYFALSNFIVIPAAFILMFLAIALLVFSQISIIASVLSLAISWLIKQVYLLLQSIENLPYSVKEITLNAPELIFLISGLFFLLIFIETKRVKLLRNALFSFVLLACFVLITNLNQLHSKEIIVFNNSNNPAILLVSGKQCYVVSQHEIAENSYQYRQIQDVKRHKRLNPPQTITWNKKFENSLLYSEDGLLCFDDKIIWIESGKNTFPQNISPDYVVMKNSKNQIFKADTKKSQLITLKNYVQPHQADGIHSLPQEGAFTKKWH